MKRECDDDKVTVVVEDVDVDVDDVDEDEELIEQNTE